MEHLSVGILGYCFDQTGQFVAHRLGRYPRGRDLGMLATM